jgi:hypothetical protein
MADGVADFLLREIIDTSPTTSNPSPRIVLPRDFVEPAIIKTFTAPATGENAVLLLATNKLLMLSGNATVFEIVRQFPFNAGNRAVALECVGSNAIILGLNVPSEQLPPGTPEYVPVV